MSKTFRTAPSPKKLSPDQIDSFEKGGPGHDSQPGNPETLFPDEETTRKPDSEGKKVEPMKRFSFDLPESVHRRFKTACSANGVTMLNEITTFIEARSDELEKRGTAENLS